MTAVRESSPITAEVMERAESTEVPIQLNEVVKADAKYQEAVDQRFTLHSCSVSLSTGVSFPIVESSGACGLEAWRLLSQKYNPRTHSRCVQLRRKIGSFSIPKTENVLTGMVHWEGMVGVLARDHKEVLSDKLRIALLISILPNGLQERVMEHLDRLATYIEVHDKLTSLVQSSTRYNVGDAMDCSGLDHGDELGDDLNIDAVSRDQCSRCWGYGHYAKDCPSPKGKTKGGGKQRPAYQDQRPGKGGVVCTHCKLPGHTEDRCWGLCIPT